MPPNSVKRGMAKSQKILVNAGLISIYKDFSLAVKEGIELCIQHVYTPTIPLSG
jgi:hypothetical protein